MSIKISCGSMVDVVDAMHDLLKARGISGPYKLTMSRDLYSTLAPTEELDFPAEAEVVLSNESEDVVLIMSKK